MDAVERLNHGLEQVSALLVDPELEPDPERRDWGEVADKVTSLERLTREEVLGNIEAALAMVEDPEEANEARFNIAYRVGEVAALLSASTRHDGTVLLAEARRLGAGLDQELVESERDPVGFVRLVQSRWRLGAGDRVGAKAAFQRLKDTTQVALYRDLAEEGIRAPDPLRRAPPLYTLNGFGVGLVGGRDRRSDGTEVKTHAVTALFIPILPLSAYRVYDHGDGRVTFLGKERLSTLARVWQILVPLAILGGVGAYLVNEHYQSPRYRAKQAYAEARRLDKAGKTRQAEAAYEALLRKYGDQASQEVVQGAGARLVEIYSAAVRPPVTWRSLRDVRLVHQRYRALHGRARGGPAAARLTRALEGWAGAMDEKDAQGRAAALELLDLAARVAGGADRQRVVARARGIRIGLADRMAAAWPVRALSLYDAYREDPGALGKAGAVLSGIVRHPFLLLSEAELVERWLRAAAGKAALAATRTAVTSALARARALAAAPDRKAVLEKPEVAKLTAYLSAHPEDQPVAVALAQARRQRGDLKAAQAVLEALGPPGVLVPEARMVLAAVFGDLGLHAKAEPILEALLEGRLPRFQQAQRRYGEAATALQNRLFGQLQAGTAPPEIGRRLEGAAGDDEKQKIATEWVREQLAGDAELRRLKADYEAHQIVVPAALSLGMVKLRLARAAAGAARDRLLGESERLFLAIRQEAEGLASYHLALGQVYYRLGKVKEAEPEFRAVLSQKDQRYHLEAASAYRGLGMVKEARAAASDLWQKTEDASLRSSAAVLMSVMADNLDEEERWLKRAAQGDPGVEIRLLEVRARRLQSEGKEGEADGLFARAEAHYLKDADHNGAAANNAAVASQNRFSCTGDPRHLRQSLKSFEAALRLQPESTVVTNNLAHSAHHLALVEILTRRVRMAELRLNVGEARSLVGLLLAGPQRDAILLEMSQCPRLRRRLELLGHEQVLAPNKTDAYGEELDWHELRRDVPRLTELLGRLSQQTLNTAAAAERRQSYLRGARDAEIRERTEADIKRWQRVLARPSLRHPPTRAAAYLFAASAVASRSSYRSLASDVEQSLASLKEAKHLWPDLNVTAMEASLLLQLAILKAGETSPALAALWRGIWRRAGALTLLHRLLTLPPAEAAPLRKALLAQPALAASIALRRPAQNPRPGLTDWLLGRLAADAVLEAHGRAVLTRQDRILSVKISRLLYPHSEETRLEEALLAGGATPAGAPAHAPPEPSGVSPSRRAAGK